MKDGRVINKPKRKSSKSTNNIRSKIESSSVFSAVTHPVQEQGEKWTKIFPSSEFKFRKAYGLNFHFLKN